MSKKNQIRRIRKVVRLKKPVDPSEGKPIIIGVDPSLQGSAVVVLGSICGHIEWSHGWTVNRALQKRHVELLSYFKLPEKAGHADRLSRVRMMADWVLECIREWAFTPDYHVHVAMEGLAVSQRSNRASDLAELSGYVKQGMMQMDVPFRLYDPTTLKMAWTGQGKADKAAMVMQCFRRWKVDYTELEEAGDNFADATLLAQLLRHEVEIRAGRMNIRKDIDGQLRKILLRKTKDEPVPLISQPLISPSGIAAAPAVLGGP